MRIDANGDGMRLAPVDLRDPEWLKWPMAFTHALASPRTLWRSLLGVADEALVPVEGLALWLWRCLVAWPAVKTFLLLTAHDLDVGVGDAYRDRRFASQDAASVPVDAPRRPMLDLARATLSSRRHCHRQDLVAHPRENFDSSPPRGWSSTSTERRIR